MPKTDHRTPSRVIVLEADLVDSAAFLVLSSTSIVVLMGFMRKRQMKKREHQRRKDVWEILNNGRLTYTFKEAQARGIPKQSFNRAIKQLVEVGFIDVTRPGIGGRGIHNQPTTYALSDRWQKWGTPDFQRVDKPTNSLTRIVGFSR